MQLRFTSSMAFSLRDHGIPDRGVLRYVMLEYVIVIDFDRLLSACSCIVQDLSDKNGLTVEAFVA